MKSIPSRDGQETESFQNCSTQPRKVETLKENRPDTIEENEEREKKAVRFGHTNRRAYSQVKQGRNLIRLRLWSLEQESENACNSDLGNETANFLLKDQ